MPKEKWQALKALPTTGPYYKYRILRGRMLFNPVGSQGKRARLSTSRTFVSVPRRLRDVTLSTFSADTNECIFLSASPSPQACWKWRSEKGLSDYAGRKAPHETLANNAAGRDGTKPRIDMSQESQRMVPGIWVPGKLAIDLTCSSPQFSNVSRARFAGRHAIHRAGASRRLERPRPTSRRCPSVMQWC